MLPASAERITERLEEGDVVLDVGGWAVPFARADWVIDLMPYATRGGYGPPQGGTKERFDAERWVERDICAREPWPFEDGQFDFAVCSQTLEDVRDPVWVCSELNRVAGAGYLEVPSRLEEQSHGVHGPWVGWSHHHWLCDVEGDGIDFVFKSHVLHGRPDLRFPNGFASGLAPEERVQQLWWEGGFEFRERVLIETEEHDEYLASFVAANLRRHDGPARPSLRSRLFGRQGG